MREFETKLGENQVDVKIVTFDSLARARFYKEEFEHSWPILIDPEAELYRAYGMTRATLWNLINPWRIFRYLQNILGGATPGKRGRDLRQLGGDIVIDPVGRISLCHVSKHPHDRPSIRQLMKLLEENKALV